MVFPIVMYGCESWSIKKAEHQRIDAFELWCWRRLLRVPWTTRRANQSVLKEMSRIFIGRTDVEAETPILWPPGAKSWLIWKDPDAGKDWRWEKKGMTEDEMVRWHHWLNGHEFEWTPGVGDGQGSLACCSSWGHKESDTTELDWTELNWTGSFLYSPDFLTGTFGVSVFLSFIWGFPGGASGKEPTCQCRRHKRCWFDPWVGKIP